MTDYAAFCPVVNRFDLLEQVIAACDKAQTSLTVIDNSPVKELKVPFPHSTARSFQPMTFSQSMNFEFADTATLEAKFCLHMHSDAVIPDGAIERLLEKAREIDAQGRKWGVIYTFYDILACYNPKAYQAIGGYDTNLPAYFSDNDWYYRLDLAGWERINTGIEVGHGPDGNGSQTINSDPYLKNLNGITFPLYRQYYVAKWGGEPGKERYKKPFNDFSRNRIQVTV